MDKYEKFDYLVEKIFNGSILYKNNKFYFTDPNDIFQQLSDGSLCYKLLIVSGWQPMEITQLVKNKIQDQTTKIPKNLVIFEGIHKNFVFGLRKQDLFSITINDYNIFDNIHNIVKHCSAKMLFKTCLQNTIKIYTLDECKTYELDYTNFTKAIYHNVTKLISINEVSIHEPIKLDTKPEQLVRRIVINIPPPKLKSDAFPIKKRTISEVDNSETSTTKKARIAYVV